MNETWLGTIPLIGLMILSVGCWFYMWGGRCGKWKRRFIGSFIASCALWTEYILLGQFKWLMLLVYPLTVATFCLGYGADIVWRKITKRSIVVAASLVTGVLLSCLYGTWLVLPMEVIIAGVSVYLGVKNPIQAAPEEYFICLLLWVPKLMYPFA